MFLTLQIRLWLICILYFWLDLRNELQNWLPQFIFRSILLYEIFVIMQLQVDLLVILEYYTASLH